MGKYGLVVGACVREAATVVNIEALSVDVVEFSSKVEMSIGDEETHKFGGMFGVDAVEVAGPVDMLRGIGKVVAKCVLVHGRFPTGF